MGVKVRELLLLLGFVFFSACSITQVAADPNGLTVDDDGNVTQHLNTTNYAVHLFFSIPMFGNGSIPETVDELTDKARKIGATEVHITHSSTASYWWNLFPVGLVFTPVVTEVTANIVMPKDKAGPGRKVSKLMEASEGADVAGGEPGTPVNDVKASKPGSPVDPE